MFSFRTKTESVSAAYFFSLSSVCLSLCPPCPDDFRYLVAPLYPFGSCETPRAPSWEHRNNYYEEKRISSRVAASLFVDRIIFEDPALVREDGAHRRKKKGGKIRATPPLFPFLLVDPPTGATSPFGSQRGVSNLSREINISP